MDFWVMVFTPQVRQILPILAVLLVTGLLCFLTWLITRYSTNQEWRKRLRLYMPHLAREALKEAEQRAETAEAAAKAATEERDVLAAELSAVRQIVSAARDPRAAEKGSTVAHRAGRGPWSTT